MALIKCSECGKQISDQAQTCPHCGVSIKSYTYCSNCGAKVVSDNFCTNCGVSTDNNLRTSFNKKMSSIALSGGITGICSLIIDPFGILSIVAIVLSSIGLAKCINNSLSGKGWAITGLVCGILELLFKVVVLINYFS